MESGQLAKRRMWRIRLDLGLSRVTCIGWYNLDLELPRSHGQFSAGNCQPLMRPQQGSRRDLVAWSISVHRTLIDTRLTTARRSADEHILMTVVHVTPSSGIPRAGGALQSGREIKASKPRRAWQRAGNGVAPLPDGLDAVVERST
jgi:hypothetical protein